MRSCDITLPSVITLSCLLTFIAIASARPFNPSCLELSTKSVGEETGEFISSVNELFSANATTQMRLTAVTTCTNNLDNVVGLQLILSVDPYQADYIDDSEQRFKLDSIGKLEGDCQTIKLSSPLDKIQVQSTRNEINSIKYYRSGSKKGYGQDGMILTDWYFTLEKPLIGLWGR